MSVIEASFASRLAAPMLILFALTAAGAQVAPPTPSPTPPQAAQPAPPPTQPVSSLLANLTSPLDISRVKVGTVVNAHVISAWSGGACNLPLGALIQGHVSEVEKKTKASPRSAFQLVFDQAECDHHHMSPMKITIMALLGPSGPDAPNGESGVAQTQALTATPLAISGMRSVETASSRQDYAAGNSRPTTWKPGMVVDVPNMNLTPGTAADTASTIWAMNKDARLEAKTTLIMVPVP
jgi:hypothetical protein